MTGVFLLSLRRPGSSCQLNTQAILHVFAADLISMRIPAILNMLPITAFRQKMDMAGDSGSRSGACIGGAGTGMGISYWW